METRNKIVFIAMVFMAYVLAFAVQRPFFLFYNYEVWTGMSAAAWGTALFSGLLFDSLLAGCLAGFPAILALFCTRFPERIIKGVLRIYFFLTGLYIAAVFAFSGVFLTSRLPQVLLFVCYAAAIVALFWEGIVPAFGRIAVNARTGRRISVFLIGLLLLVVGSVVSTGGRSVPGDASDPGLYHLAINPYYELVFSGR